MCSLADCLLPYYLLTNALLHQEQKLLSQYVKELLI